MEKMPILVLLLYSIPESIILISLSTAIYGYQVRENIYRIILLGMTLALTTYIVRGLPIKLGLNALIEVPLFIFLTSLYLRLSWIRSFFVILTGFLIIILFESISYPLVSALFKIPVKQIFEITWLRLLTGWSYLLIMGTLTAFLLKRNISLIKAATFFHPKSRSGKVNILLISLVLIQAVLSGIFNLIMLAQQNENVWPVSNSIIFTKITGLLLFTIPIISVFLVKKIFSASEQEAIAETQEAFIDNINKLFTTIRGQRHDFIHHVQVIYSMLNINQINEAIKYMDNLLDEIQIINNVIKVKDPVLSALFNTKMAIAERHSINFEVIIRSSLDNFNLKPFELVKILGNLIDNALEAVENQPTEYRQVIITVDQISSFFRFNVYNPRPILNDNQITKVFESGFTTKNNHTGLGLAVVKELVERTNGMLSVTSSDGEGTSFIVLLPKK